MNYYEEKAQQSDAELCKDGSCIEPEWTRAHALAEKVMAQFEAEHFKPILKTLSDQFTAHLWNILRDHLISDTEQNIAGHIRDRIDRTITALLGGAPWAVDLYVTSQGYDHLDLRRELAKLIPVPLQDARIKDLEAQVVTLEKDLARERQWNDRR